VPGLDPAEPLFPVEAAGLLAAVSYVPAAEFDEQPLNDLVSDLERLAPYAVRHEAAIGSLVASAPGLIPMGFGAVYHDPERIAAVLRERKDEFRLLLDYVRGRREWGLKVTVDPARAREAAAAESDELLRLNEAIATASPGRAYLLRRQRDGLVGAATDRLTRATLAEIYHQLASRSVASVEDEISADHPPVGPRLALKAAFLVGDDQVDDFRREAARLAREHGRRGLAVEITGPWAPYSFVTSGAA
jgi:hypothetical protein